MIEIEVQPIPDDVNAALHSAVAAFDLSVASETTLKSFPGSRHWHLKKERGAGVLEVTFWPAKNRLRVSFHVNRIGDGWVAEVAPRFAKTLARWPSESDIPPTRTP